MMIIIILSDMIKTLRTVLHVTSRIFFVLKRNFKSYKIFPEIHVSEKNVKNSCFFPQNERIKTPP